MNLAVAVDNSEREETSRRKLPLRRLTLDKAMQPREKIDGATVDRYAELLLEGVALPPVTVVLDGEKKFWLGDGFHRFYGHEKAGLREIEAEVRLGSKIDAILIALRANAEHGRPRSDKDLKRAYRLAVQHDLVKPWDVDGVAKLIACTQQWARRLTEDVRNAREAELRQKMFELKEQGVSQREIAAALNVDRGIVRRYFDSLKPADPKGGPKRNSFETAHPEATADPAPEDAAGDEIIEQVNAWDEPINQDDDYGIRPEHDEGPRKPVYSTGADGLPQAEMFAGATPEDEPEPEDEAEPTAEHDPLAAYNEQWRAETPQREMWGKALTVLQEFAHLPEPEVLFANRYTRFDYLIKPAVDNAFNWLEAFEEKWHGPQNR
jgi:hypothetical protein